MTLNWNTKYFLLENIKIVNFNCCGFFFSTERVDKFDTGMWNIQVFLFWVKKIFNDPQSFYIFLLDFDLFSKKNIIIEKQFSI